MQLNITTDYAIRMMLYLAQVDCKTNSAEITQSLQIPINTCKKNLQLLKKRELVKARPGIDGGYFLSRKASQITFKDIVRAMDEKTEFNRCLEPDCFCNRGAVEHCPVRAVYTDAQKALDKAFQTTLQDLVNCSLIFKKTKHI